MAVPTIRAVGASAGAATAISPGLPAGTVAGDLLVMFLETDNEAITVSGWTEAPSSPQSIGTSPTGTRLTIFYKIAVGGDATTTSDSGNHQVGRIIGITTDTFNSTTPFNVSAGGTQASTTAVSIPGATTTVAECLILAACSGDLPDATNSLEFSGWANADLTAVTERIDNAAAGGNGGAIGVASGEKATAGAYAATTATAATAAQRGCISLAVAPLAVAAAAWPTLNVSQAANRASTY